MKQLGKRIRRHKSIRKYLIGVAEKPRLAVFRSSKYIYAQIIDDSSGKTLVSASDLKMDQKSPKMERAEKVGENLAKFALKKNISQVIFDRGGFLYHGRIQKLADGARLRGLKF
ncbi:MAG: 50S ribosomal protein L18 [Candidatus Daviesbacteria bacterium]|nr:50S ribosomal protein L18 [Candidatus Daviesbacteria bacterium]